MRTIIKLAAFTAMVLFVMVCLMILCHWVYQILCQMWPAPETWLRFDLHLGSNDGLFFGIIMIPLWVVTMADFWQLLKDRKRFSISLSLLSVSLLQAGVIIFCYLMILWCSLSDNWTAWLLLGTMVCYILLDKAINRMKRHINFFIL